MSRSQAPFFNQSNFFATTPIIYLKGRSFTISCWLKQTKNLDRDEVIYGDRYAGRSHFLLYRRGQKIVFRRDIPDGAEPFKLTGLSKVSLNSWTHLVVTWHHVKGTSSMYMDGNIIGHTTFSPKEMLSVYDPSGWRYAIGHDRRYGHQFNALVMDLYVFGTALSAKEINKLRGSWLTYIIIGHAQTEFYLKRLLVHGKAEFFSQRNCCFHISTFLLWVI